MIGAGFGVSYGTTGAAFAALIGALVLASVNRFIERASTRLAEFAPQEAEIDPKAGVRRPSVASLEASRGRAGAIMLLAASRFWIAILVLAGVLMIMSEHRGALLGGFIAAVLLDALWRLRAGIADFRAPRP